MKGRNWKQNARHNVIHQLRISDVADMSHCSLLKRKTKIIEIDAGVASPQSSAHVRTVEPARPKEHGASVSTICCPRNSWTFKIVRVDVSEFSFILGLRRVDRVRPRVLVQIISADYPPPTEMTELGNRFDLPHRRDTPNTRVDELIGAEQRIPRWA